MSEQAHVTTLSVLSDLKTGYALFGKEADDALSSLANEIRRIEDWLDEQMHCWKHEIRRAQEEVHETKQALDARKLLKVFDRPPDCTEQESAWRAAKQRLEFAEDKLAACRRWPSLLQRGVFDYEGPAKQLRRFLEEDLPKALSLLERMQLALSAYTSNISSPTPAPKTSTTPAPPAKKEPGS